jgi:hypothetical protein
MTEAAAVILSHEDRDINICPLQIKNLRMELRDPES